jgi:hypothetical protein
LKTAWLIIGAATISIWCRRRICKCLPLTLLWQHFSQKT